MSGLQINYTDSDAALIPQGVTIPAPVLKAMADRDAAFDAYADALIKYDDVIGQGYIERAQQRDADRARTAVLRGDDPHDGLSEVARVTAEHGRAVGIINALAERVREHDLEVYRQWLRALPDVEAELRAKLPEADKQLRTAEAQYLAALGAYRTCVGALGYVSLQRRGKIRTMNEAPGFHQKPDFAHTVQDVAREWLDALGVDTDTTA